MLISSPSATTDVFFFSLQVRVPAIHRVAFMHIIHARESSHGQDKRVFVFKCPDRVYIVFYIVFCSSSRLLIIVVIILHYAPLDDDEVFHIHIYTRISNTRTPNESVFVVHRNGSCSAGNNGESHGLENRVNRTT